MKVKVKKKVFSSMAIKHKTEVISFKISMKKSKI